MILSHGGQDDDAGAEVITKSATRLRRLRDRFSAEELQAMIDLYRSGATAKRVAEKFGVSLRSAKRLLQQHGVRRDEFGRQSVRDRLGEATVRRLVADFDTGAPKSKLAQQYGISQSSIKRLVRQYGIKRFESP